MSENQQQQQQPSAEQQLWQAAMDGDLATVERLLAETDPPVDVNWVGEDRLDTPLHRACRFGRLSVVETLLRHPRIEVNKGNKGRVNPFFIACQEGHLAVVVRLLGDERVDVCCRDGEDVTPFFMACENQRSEVALALLGDPRIDPNAFMKDELSPINRSCFRGRDDLVAVLLADPRVDVNKATKASNGTPLWYASQNGFLRVAQLLLASDKAVDTKLVSKHNGKTASGVARWASTQPCWSIIEGDDVTRRARDCPLIADLIDGYEKDPLAVRLRQRCAPGVRGLAFFLPR